jgi:DNA-binding GntR family transcriptional regulator
MILQGIADAGSGARNGGGNVTVPFSMPMLEASVRRVAAQPLPQQIAAHLRELIIHDELKPGERVREQPLSLELAVSRTPLRDALKILAVERLVDLHPNRGATVANPSVDELRDLLRVYSTMEGLGGQMACERAVQGDIDAAHRWHQEMVGAFERRDKLSYFRANQAFHLGIIAASRNASLIEVHGQLNLRLHRVRYLAIMQQKDWTFVSNQHEAIIEALDKRDGALLGRLLVEHFSSAWRALDLLEAQQTSAAAPAAAGL